MASQEETRGIVAAYLSGESTQAIADRFGYARKTCSQLLAKEGVVKRTAKDYRRYTLDTSFFSMIDSEEKAYWLGFLVADGNICGRTITLGLKLSDEGHIKKFRLAIKSAHPIHRILAQCQSGSYWSASLRISCVEMTRDLFTLGVVPKKSLTVKPATDLPTGLYRHYWRGVFDGDGCLSGKGKYVNGESRWRVRLVGNEMIVGGFMRFVAEHAQSKATMGRHRSSDMRHVEYSGTQLPLSVARVLYEDATIFLDRKMALYQMMRAA